MRKMFDAVEGWTGCMLFSDRHAVGAGRCKLLRDMHASVDGGTLP